jgi:disulfide bond formation protein DsbB
MDSEKMQHLEFIQNIITRMNTNSFQIKGMAITLLSALLAIYVSTQKVTFIFIGIPPLILFWLLDSYYLQQERKLRGVYNDVVGLKNKIEVKPYEIPIQKYTKDIDKHFSYWNVFCSQTVIWLYLTVILLLILIGGLLTFKDCLQN